MSSYSSTTFSSVDGEDADSLVGFTDIESSISFFSIDENSSIEIDHQQIGKNKNEVKRIKKTATADGDDDITPRQVLAQYLESDSENGLNILDLRKLTVNDSENDSCRLSAKIENKKHSFEKNEISSKSICYRTDSMHKPSLRLTTSTMELISESSNKKEKKVVRKSSQLKLPNQEAIDNWPPSPSEKKSYPLSAANMPNSDDVFNHPAFSYWKSLQQSDSQHNDAEKDVEQNIVQNTIRPIRQSMVGRYLRAKNSGTCKGDQCCQSSNLCCKRQQ
ncbi:hypothetical protein RDWZM_005628 [Blomia tropicalis]|uniref:Uncharacterized protein n=1 Tax=Blomia tropicalis TaxID=40697 RepID=A0A9Q0RMK5_BLOTA|nr:hypothetical protein RDWZM_005628 [Blomia tropicalis]